MHPEIGDPHEDYQLYGGYSVVTPHHYMKQYNHCPLPPPQQPPPTATSSRIPLTKKKTYPPTTLLIHSPYTKLQTMY